MEPKDLKFWKRVDKGKPDDCWPWLGAYRKKYGCFYHKGERFVAPRVALELSTGKKIPKNLKVLHSCDNPCCCNPNHLSANTQKQNIIDAFKRGRLHANKVSKLDRCQVSDIRFCCLELNFSRKKTALIFDVNPRTIGRILSGQYWSHHKEKEKNHAGSL